MDIYNNSTLIGIFAPPNAPDKLNDWLQLKGVIPFLEKELDDDYIILYASSRHLLLYSVLISNQDFSKSDIQELLEWNGFPNSWHISCSKTSCELYGPMEYFRGDILPQGEAIIFHRSLEGVANYENYFELNQKIAHSLGLHFISEKESWCRLDGNGDLEESIKEVSIKLMNKDNIRIIYAKKELLAKYAKATNQMICRMIDCSAYQDNFMGWGDDRSYENIETGVTYGSIGYAMPSGSYFRGIQLVHLNISLSKMIKDEWGENDDFVDLIVNNFKYGRIETVSCNPDELDNYFIDTGKPLEMSPAFFNAEVLRKYKSNTEKYKINGQSIECRGTWSLRSFNINDQNQVFVYLVDFNKLPYKEQLHWKQYNEEPKSGIPNRVIQTDFKGEFTNDILPLDQLKYFLRELNNKNLGWWSAKSENSFDKLHYPLTDSKDEWAEELLNFDQLVVEGFNEKWLRTKAKGLNAQIEDKHRALKLLEQILISQGFDEDHAKDIMAVFHEIHNLRSEVKGHSTGKTAEQRRIAVLREYSNFKTHFDSLSERALESLTIIKKILI